MRPGFLLGLGILGGGAALALRPKAPDRSFDGPGRRTATMGRPIGMSDAVWEAVLQSGQRPPGMSDAQWTEYQAGRLAMQSSAANTAFGGSGKLLESQKRLLERNLVLERSVGRAYQNGTLDGESLATILGNLEWIRNKINNPHGNRMGQSCWELSKASNGVVTRWIYGGGNVGDIAEGILGIPRGGAGSVWNLNWGLGDIMAAVGLNPLDCEGYFSSIRQRYAQIDAICAAKGQVVCKGLADATAEEVGGRSENVLKPIKEKPEQSIMPFVFGIAGTYLGVKFLGSYMGARSREANVDRAVERALARQELRGAANYDDDDADYGFDDGPTCPVCSGVSVELGTLGNLTHARCRDCGAEYSYEAGRCAGCGEAPCPGGFGPCPTQPDEFPDYMDDSWGPGVRDADY